MIDYENPNTLNTLANKIYQNTNAYSNAKLSTYQTVYSSANFATYQNAYTYVNNAYANSESILIKTIEPEVLYKYLRKEILNNNVLSIYSRDFTERSYTESIYYNDKSYEIAASHVSYDRPVYINIKIVSKDYSEDNYCVYDNTFDINKLYEDGITKDDFVIAGSNIFLIKHISSIKFNSIGRSTFCTVWFKEAVTDDKGNIIEEGYSRAFTLKEYMLPDFKKSLENAGRYDLLLNL